MFLKMLRTSNISRSTSTVLCVIKVDSEKTHRVFGMCGQDSIEWLWIQLGSYEAVSEFIRMAASMEIHKGMFELHLDDLLHLVLLSCASYVSFMVIQIQNLDVMMLIDFLKWKFKVFSIDLKSMREGVSSKWFIIVMFRLLSLTACRSSKLFLEWERKSEQCVCSYCYETFILRFKGIQQPSFDTSTIFYHGFGLLLLSSRVHHLLRPRGNSGIYSYHLLNESLMLSKKISTIVTVIGKISQQVKSGWYVQGGAKGQ